ncbi:MAG TPA: HAD-IIB family hydrolase [Gemmatimonadaceae bacterium]|jgi:HAD superfamily hydrolase (TIGR01484 family)
MRLPSVYTDVDGTLLDDDGRLAFAVTTLREVATRVHLVLTSSRTLDELAAFTAAWNISADLIAENGAWIGRTAPTPRSESVCLAGRAWWIRRVGAPRREVRQAVLDVATAHGVTVDFTDEWSHTTWIAETGQTLEEAKRARLRRGSVLLRDASPAVVRALRQSGLDAEPGGRWTCVTLGAGKGAAARLLATLSSRSGAMIGVGDAANDRSLLETADRAFIVRHRNGTVDPALSRLAPPATILASPGPQAWPELLEHLPPAVR